MSPVRMQLPVTAAVHMTKKQAHLGLLPASELRKGRTMAQKQKLQNSGMQIPDDAILRIAQAMLPLMQQYFESEEGRLQLSRQTEALEQKEAAPASQPAPPLIFAHYLCVDIKIINPNPSPIRKKFGFINNGDPYRIGKQRSGSVEPSPETVHRTVSLNHSIPALPEYEKIPDADASGIFFMVKQNLPHPNFLHGWQA